MASGTQASTAFDLADGNDVNLYTMPSWKVLVDPDPRSPYLQVHSYYAIDVLIFPSYFHYESHSHIISSSLKRSSVQPMTPNATTTPKPVVATRTMGGMISTREWNIM